MARKKTIKEEYDYSALDCLPFQKENGEEVNADELSYIAKYLEENIKSFILSVTSDSEDKIIYRPFDSFTHSKEWTAGRYVGELSIIIPKEQIKNAKKDRKARLIIKPRFGTPFLCHMLEEIYNVKLPESLTSYEKGPIWNKFYQLILRQLWIAKFAKADKYGLPRQTVKRTHQGMQIHGHLNVRKSILPFFTKKEVVSEYREKEVDDTIGRIVYKAYDILADKKTGLHGLPPQVQESINDLYSRYHGQQIKITEHDYQNIRYKSIYESWKPLVDFSWQIIKHHGYNPERSIDEQGYGLFFDMAEIWEAYIGKILEKEFVHCTEQNSNIKLFENEREKEFQKIIPDYLSRDWTNEHALAVADAKYMDLAGKEELQEEQTYSVFYKTITYMYRFNSLKGFIFFPMKSDDPTNNVQVFEIAGGMEGTFYKIGMKVPETNKDYVKFIEALTAAEENFRKAVFDKLLINASS